LPERPAEVANGHVSVVRSQVLCSNADNGQRTTDQRCDMPDTTLPRERAAVAHPAESGRLRPRYTWLTDSRMAWLFLLPTMILLLLIAIFPLIWSLYLSFTQYSVIQDATTGPKWVGLQNYAQLLSDRNVWNRFTLTASFVVPAVGIELVLGFALALLL